MTEPDLVPDAVCDGGDLDCGSGLLLIIRNAMSPLAPGGMLEVRSRESSVKEDLPAWCRLVGHDMLKAAPGEGGYTSYYVRKKTNDVVLQQDLEQARNFVWRARVRSRGGMEAQVFVRNHSFVAGQPASFDTADKNVSAVEYLLGSLGACLAVGFQWRASRRGVQVRNLEVTIQAKSEDILSYLGLDEAPPANSGTTEGAAAGHAGLAAVQAVVYVDAEADEETLQQLLADTVSRSPVAQTLQNAIPIGVQLRTV